MSDLIAQVRDPRMRYGAKEVLAGIDFDLSARGGMRIAKLSGGQRRRERAMLRAT